MPSVCYRFLHKQCPLSAAMCPLSHDKDDAPLCMYWKKGPCPSGNWCVNRHYYLEKDSWAKVARANNHQGDDIEFNSPLVVKVKNVVETHRREEVDLETGRRRSWIETENKELIDITGEDSPLPAPIKKVSLKKDKVVKKKIDLEEEVKETQGKSKEEMLSKKLGETGIAITVVEKRKQVGNKSTSKENTKTVDDKSSDKNKNKSTTSRKVEKRKVTTALEKTNESNENSVAEKQNENENEKPKTGAQNCSVCGRSFKGDRGMQMHLARSSCGKQSVN